MRRFNRVLAALLTFSIVMSNVSASAVEQNTAAEETTVSSDTVSEQTAQQAEIQTETSAEPEAVQEEQQTPAVSTQSEEEQVSTQAEGGTLNLSELTASGVGITGDTTAVEVNCQNGNADALILLSNCTPADLESLKITVNVSGTLNLTSTALYDGGTYSYQSIGTDVNPFKGTFDPGSGVTYTVKTPMFGVLESGATISSFNIKWAGADGNVPMFVKEYRFTDTNSHEIPVKISTEQVNGRNTYTMSSLISKVTGQAGTLKVNKNTVDYTNASAVTVTESTGDAGLICGSLEAGTIQLDGYTAPTTTSSYTVTASSGNAGGLIGSMADGTGLNITGTENITLNTPTVTGKTNAGGLVGVATNVTFSGLDKVEVKSPTVATQTDSSIGGLIGEYTLSGQTPATLEVQLTVPSFTTPGTNSSKIGNIGGVFGTLKLNAKDQTFSSYTIDVSSDLTITRKSASKTCGAIIGQVIGSGGVQNALVVNGQNNSIKAENTSKAQPDYYGGIIGKIGEKDNADSAVYVEIKNVNVTAQDPFGLADDCGFGGIVGCVGNSSVLKIADIKAATEKGTQSDKPIIWEGGGVVGLADKESVVVFSGTTDLSGVQYVPRIQAGQLVGKQDNALIYAKGDGNGNGWKFIRAPRANMKNDGSSTKISELDDIGNYGQVYRLKAEKAEYGLAENFITINDTTHAVTINNDTNFSENDITLSSAEDFAALAIAWQSRGTFVGNNANKNQNFTTKNITLAEDINLTGTGVQGLTRDSTNQNNGNQDLDSKDIYSGTFDGGNHTLTLAIGETYGTRNGQDTDTGSMGQLCRHEYAGLFAAVNSGTVKDLTLAGTITVDGMANTIQTGSRTYYVGGYAAKATGKITTENITLSETITVSAVMYNNNGTKEINVNAGGLYGKVEESTDLAGVTSKTTIHVKTSEANTPKFDKIYAGGVIGALANNKAIIVNCNNVSLGGTITSEASGAAQIGGLIGYSEYNTTDNTTNRRTININSVTVNGQSVTANSATSSGGLLGYLWADTDVNFVTPTQTDTETTYALTVTGGTVSATKNGAEAGGLVYRGSGKWTVNNYGISMTGGTFSAENLGLLLCHAGQKEWQKNVGSNGLDETKALYLEMTENWETAYNLTDGVKVDKATVFDELIAYTAGVKAAKTIDITTNDRNGIISLATKDRKGVALDGNTCNTYQNRTDYNVKINLNTRYYYNLDDIKNEVETQTTTQYLNTPEKLLLWSVYTYASSSIKPYFSSERILNNGNERAIGAASGTPEAELDMKGLSYYPVNVYSKRVQRATITFYNDKIETLEENNKSTKGTTDSHSQHYMMHCGLFYNMISGSDKDQSATISTVTFSGTVGMVNGGSGALACGSIHGNENPAKTYSLNLTTIVLNDLFVNGATDQNYAPVLINEIGSYTSLSADDVDTTGYNNITKPAGSSLIGNVGGDDKTQITVKFSQMHLPDTKYTTAEGNTGIFTHATFLEKFEYKADGGVGSGSYTFLRGNDYDKTGETRDHNKVTYGKEISESVEYKDEQRKYYDEDTYYKEEKNAYVVISDDVNYKEQDFSAYLPYVCQTKVQKKDEDATKHEIMVNLRAKDILTGCGTYGHPYTITEASEMITLAEYLATATARSDWKVTITGEQNTMHGSADANDVTYIFDGTWKEVTNNNGTWKKVTDGKTLSNTVMHRYLLSAYYNIDKDITLDNFTGFGGKMYPFRGVIVSTNKTITLTGTVPNGLIPYSYGSVVKDVAVKYEGSGKTLSYSADKDETTISSTGQLNNYNTLPESFFGGVIGCIVGGDNIIDGVSVTMDSDWKLKLDGTKKHLIEVGGYVGSVAGGGVIFRNMNKKAGLSDTNLTDGSVNEDAASSLYVNPYVGRVLDGYAFSEGCELDNTDKNYKINQLDDTKEKIKTENNTVTVSNEQGLLVLSAIVNSGGASGGNTYAYWKTAESFNTTEQDKNYQFGNGTYGKVRRASYQYVGKSTETGAEADFAIANADDTSVPSETVLPYLVNKYSNAATFSISDNTKNVLIQLAENGDYDLTTYGNGYQGISARYLSNAVNAGQSTIGSVFAKPLITGFKGNGNTVKVSMDVKEYADDDFHSASVGGVFNLLRPVNANETTAGTDDAKALVSKLTIVDSTVKLTYVNANGTETDEASEKLTQAGGKYCVGVGGFAGSTSANDLDPNNNNNAGMACYYFRDINIQNSTFNGPNGVGGLIGSTGMVNQSVKKGIGLMFRNVRDEQDSEASKNKTAFGVNLVDCTHNGITVKAGYAAGGFVGYVSHGLYNKNDTDTDSAYFKSFRQSNVNLKSSFSVTKNTTFGEGSSITSTARNGELGVNAAGGIFGAVSMNLNVNADTNSETATINNITVKMTGNGTYSSAGGAIGRVEINLCTIKNIDVTGNSTVISAPVNAGGIIGCYANNWNNVSITVENCTAKDITVKDGLTNVGGIVGGLYYCNHGTAVNKVINCTADTVTAAPGGKDTSTGGIVGCTRGQQKLTIQGCTVKESTIGTEKNLIGWNGGLLGSVGGGSTGAHQLSFYDSTVKDSNIYGQVSGALSSSVYTKVYGSNLLVDTVDVHADHNQWISNKNYFGGALLIGYASNLTANKEYGIFLAGVSIQGDCTFNNAKNTNDSSKRLIAQQMDGYEKDIQIKSKVYIALADYTGDQKGKANTLDATPAAPYVVTSPKYDKIKIQVVKKDEDGNDTDETEIKYLFGDGADKTIAQQIVAKNGGADKFEYNDTGVTDFNFSAFGTYNDNNAENPLPKDEKNSTETEVKYKNFDVLQVNSGEEETLTTKTITDYLNIITNGGYSKAESLGKVDVETALYQRVGNTDIVFQKQEEKSPLIAEKITSAEDNSTSWSFTASASGYDSTQQRFTLLTVTFQPDENDDHVYKVQVPIIVRRVLEVDFTATLNYGTHFKPSDYNRTGHVLDSFGNSMTAYLTYTYGSALNEAKNFGWQTFIDGGGNVAQSMEKQIVFQQDANIPAGTQLTLIDCKDKNRTAYYYTVPEDNGSNKKFTFSDFKASDGNTTFGSTSIGERIGIEVSENTNGKFVETTAEDATVKRGEKYYRLAKAEDKAATKYTVTVTKEAQDTFESYCTENYYLVITMPQNDSVPLVNGYIRTSFDTTNIPYNVNYILQNKTVDSHTNTASTYLLSNGYQQELTETLTPTSNVKEISAADSAVSISIQDKITFPINQAYNESDQLYQRFTGILQTQDENQSVSASSFPSGTSGNVKFYVYTETNGTRIYYTYDASKNAWNTDNASANTTPAVSYTWTSNGGNMELLLSEDGTIDKAISLQEIRKTVKNANSQAESGTFYVEAVLDAVIPPTGLGVIPESALKDDGSPAEFATLSYVSQLSTETNTLSYSSTKETLQDTKMQYYRAAAKTSELTYDADDINQLGINLLDLEPNLDAEKQHAVIATTAIYDLAALPNLQDTLIDSTCIRFTMTLKKKDTNNTETYENNALTDAESYMSVQVGSQTIQPTNGTWTWDIPKSEYVEKTTDGKQVLKPADLTQFTQAILLQVNVDNVQAYSNYEVTLTAQVIDEDGSTEVTSDSDNVIYTLTKIKPEFVNKTSGN